MSKEDRRPLARMFARRCWQEAMHELHEYGKRNYYLLSNGLEAARYDDSYKEASEKFYEELKKL
jgi:collagenase-like PrtC family protease